MKKNDDLKVGDKVTITDGSYSVRVDAYSPYTSIGLCKDVFEIVSVASSHLITVTPFNTNIEVHNIYIRNTVNGRVYLHSKAFVKKVLTEAESISNQIEELKIRIAQIEDKL